MKKDIIIAVPRGRIIEESKKILNKTSFAPDPLLFDSKTRKLTFESKKKNIKYIKVRAFDVCTFVAFGAAQIGIAGDDIIKEAAMAKLFSSEMCMNVTTEAIQILGGYGYIKEYDVERFFRDSKILEIGEGTSEIQRIIISREILNNINIS